MDKVVEERVRKAIRLGRDSGLSQEDVRDACLRSFAKVKQAPPVEELDVILAEEFSLPESEVLVRRERLFASLHAIKNGLDAGENVSKTP